MGIWLSLKRRLVKKLLKDPYSTILRNNITDYSIKLNFETKVDGRLLLESQIVHRIIRLQTSVSFRAPKGGWTSIRDAIINTGCPVSVIPRRIWTKAHHYFLSDERDEGIAGQRVTMRLGVITLRLHDEETISPPFEVKADLAESDTIPLILGFEDVITEILLVCDFKEDNAYAIFTP